MKQKRYHKLMTLLAVAVSGCGLPFGCSSKRSPQGAPTDSSAASRAALFKDVAEEAGIRFKHDLGDTGRFYMVENTAPGCAFLDYNNDDYLDIFLVQSGSSEPAHQVKSRPFCQLYRNNRDGTFTNVTVGSGFEKDLGYAQGVAVGDYDNDGFDDLFITAYGGNHLFRNQKGTGRFSDVTKAMGLHKIHGTGYASSAAWGDYDADGKLDLYVCYYLRWNHTLNKECRNERTNELDYCFPGVYEPVSHQLFHNDGPKFTDVSQKAGIAQEKSHGLAVAFVDCDDDGRQDIFVANDLRPNMLWRNNGDGSFTNIAAEAGCAYGEEGKAMAAMGIAIADYDHSGRESLYVTNYSGRPNILFKNIGPGLYEDATMPANLSLSHLPFLSFGCEFFDYDADGWPDIITNNGHVQRSPDHRTGNVSEKQRKQLLHNEKNGRFEEVSNHELLGDLMLPTVGRGLATGDFDNDGQIDVLTTGQNADAQLFHNRVSTQNHWLSLKLIGTKSNRNAVGAKVTIRYGGTQQTSSVRGGSSYLSSSDRRLYFGLGTATQADEVQILWPSGKKQSIKNLKADAFYKATEGKVIETQKYN
jgi:enediyne biosynthesis protein E4